MFSVEEAVDATTLCRSTLYELMAAGDLESVTVGRRRLIPAQALEDFIAKLRRVPAA
ncbi:MAG: helix-turn-helix domain-containing protein [Acidimicrobiales bacterium]